MSQSPSARTSTGAVPHSSIVVVGAGVLGASLAYHLSTRGHAVTLVDAGLPASGATAASFGWIGRSTAPDLPSVRLRSIALDEWRRLARELPSLPVQWGGSLTWGKFGDPNGDRRTMTDPRAIEPRLANPPTAAFHSGEQGAADPVAVTDLLVAAAVDRGARLRIGTSVVGIRQDGRTVIGVETSDGPLFATTVVLAAGTGTAPLCAGIGVDVPVFSSPAILVRLRAEPGLVRGIIGSTELEVRQCSDGTLLVPNSYEGQISRTDLMDTAQRVRRLVMRSFTDVGDVEVISSEVGWRPMTADGEPIIGNEVETPGLYLGVMHSGVSLAAAVGRLAAEEIITGRRAPELAGCRRSRFAQ